MTKSSAHGTGDASGSLTVCVCVCVRANFTRRSRARLLRVSWCLCVSWISSGSSGGSWWGAGAASDEEMSRYLNDQLLELYRLAIKYPKIKMPN